MAWMIGEPSRDLSGVDFALGGTDFQGDVGRARMLRYFPVNMLSSVISASRINLNVARRPHATVRASSTSRLFELAAAGAAIVTNPYEGIEQWFEPGSELRVTASSWLTREPPSSSGGRRESASSTSTRSPTGPGACSTS
jgi:hypothetical protein